MRFLDRGDLALVVGALHFLRGDVGRELYDLVRLLTSIKQRIVGRMNPDDATALCDTAKFARLKFAAPQTIPERAIFGAVARFGRNEKTMILAFDFVELIAKRAEEIGVCVRDRAIEIKLNDGLRFVQGVHFRG